MEFYMINRRLDIGGEKGNAFYILGLVGALLGDDDKDIVKEIREKMKSGDYNNLLKVFKEHFPMVELYSHNKLSNVDKNLYTFDEHPDVMEL
jgi:hypothetical protein